MRAAARLTAAGCRVFRSSVADAQSRVSSGSFGHQVASWHLFFFTHGKWTSNGDLGSSWESSRKHGREFPARRRSVWLVWRAFRAVSKQFWCRLAGRPALVKPARTFRPASPAAACCGPGARNPHGPAQPGADGPQKVREKHAISCAISPKQKKPTPAAGWGGWLAPADLTALMAAKHPNYY